MRRPLKNTPRDRQLNLSLTAAEFDNIRARAASVGLRPALFARAVLCDAKHSRPSTIISGPAEPSPLLRLTYNQLMRVGNNLNQLMRHLHRTGDPPPADLAPLLRDIRALLARVQS